jgi:uncharacterized phage infection (PIP) family protein YhgE
MDEHLIQLRIRAREEASAKLKKLNEEIDKTNALLEEQDDKRTKAARALKKSSEEQQAQAASLRKEIASLNAEVTNSQRLATKETEKFQRAIDKLDQGFRKIRTQEYAKGLQKAVSNLKEAQRETNNLEKSVKSASREIGRSNFAKAYEKGISKIRTFAKNSHEFYRQQRDDIQFVNRASEDTLREQGLLYDTLSGKAVRSYSRIRNSVKGLDDDHDSAFGRLIKSWRALGDNAEHMTRRLTRVGLAFRGLAITSAIAFVDSLNSAVVALGGQLIALAGSAIYAAGALGGTFVAAVSQAIPVIGLLGATMSRLGAVQEAVAASEALKASKAQEGATADRESANAADAVRGAQEGVVDANRQVREAQEELTEARKDARRELQDLILAEREAELAARQSELSLFNAQEARRQAIAGGDLGGLLQSELDVAEARLGRRRSRIDLNRARQDADAARQGGVEGMETYKNAVKAVEDAERSAKRATQELADVHKDNAMAIEDSSAAVENLNYALQQLTPAERRLYDTLRRIKERFRDTFNPITDIIIDSITLGIDRAENVLFNTKIVRGVRRLAEQIGNQMDRISDFFDSPRVVRFWEKMLGEGRRNLKPLTDIFLDLARIWMNIAEAAAPVLRKVLKLIRGDIEGIKDSTKDRSSLDEFFETGFKHFKAWHNLIGSIINLIGALMNVSEGSALKTLDDITGRIDNARKAIQDNSLEATLFFNRTSVAFGYMIDILEEIGKVMYNAFDEDALHDFYVVFEGAIIPAIEAFLEISAAAADVLAFLIEDTPLGPLIKLAASFMAAKSAAGIFAIALVALAKPIGVAIRLVGALWEAVGLLMKRFAGTAAGEAIGIWIGNLVGSIKLKGKKVVDAVKKHILDGVAKVRAWTTAASEAIGTFVGEAVTKLKGARERFKTQGRWLGRALIAGMVAAFIYFLPDIAREIKKFAETELALLFDDIGTDLGATFFQAIATMMNKIFVPMLEFMADKVNDLIDNIDRLNPTVELPDDPVSTDFSGFEINQDAINTAKDNIEAYQEALKGLGGPMTVLKKHWEELSQAQKDSHGTFMQFVDAKSDKILAQAVEDLDDNTDAHKKQNREVKEGQKENEKLNKELKRGQKQQKELGDQTKDTSKKQDDQGSSARRLMRRLGNLIETLFGTKKESRSLGEMIGDVTNRVLKEFGADELKFDLPTLGSIARGALSAITGGAFAEGGFLGNKTERGHDSLLVRAAPGEAFLSGWQQQPVEMAMAYANTAGLIPYRNLDDLFNKERRGHSTAPKSHFAFAKGGRVPGVPKSFPDADGALPGLDALAWFAAQKFGLTRW